jgi:hypothetical protein
VPFVRFLQPLEAKINEEMAIHVKKVIVFLLNCVLCFEEYASIHRLRSMVARSSKHEWGLNNFFATYFEISMLVVVFMFFNDAKSIKESHLVHPSRGHQEANVICI